jgi:cytochrome c553
MGSRPTQDNKNEGKIVLFAANDWTRAPSACLLVVMKIRPHPAAAAGLLGLLSFTQAHGSDATIAAGRKIALLGSAPERPGCASCHLLNGAGQPDVGIPRLAGLTSSYIMAQLGYFAAGTRHNVAMAPYAVSLSAAQKQEAADYFASLPVPVSLDQPVPAADVAAHGRALFLEGDYRTGVLACSQCHGSTGAGVGDFSPRLAGQSAAYVEDELKQWHGGAMRDPHGAYMQAEARNLSETDIQALAAYVAAMRLADNVAAISKEKQTP